MEQDIRLTRQVYITLNYKNRVEIMQSIIEHQKSKIFEAKKEKAIEHGVFRAPKIPQKSYEFLGCKKLRFLLTSIFESYTKNQIAVDTQKQVILAQKVVKGPRHDSKGAIHTIRKTKKHKP